MEKLKYSSYEMTNERIKALYVNAVFVFDSSALLDFYSYSDKTRRILFQKVFKSLKDRLWIPHQVEYEYLKNRQSVIEKPIRAYRNLIQSQKGLSGGGFIDSINDHISSIIDREMNKITGLLNTAKESTSGDTKHPHLKQALYKDFEKETKDFIKETKIYQKKYNEFKRTYEKEVDLKITQLRKTTETDAVISQIRKHFKIGEPLDFEHKLKILEEGVLRYSNQIPPGYLDDDKTGLQVYGDLILWKEILFHGLEEGKSIVLITNDQKEDWWQFENKKRTRVPRHELIQEFISQNHQDFWMLTSEDFLFHASQEYNIKIDEKLLSEVKKLSQQKAQELIEQDEERRIIDLQWLELLKEALDEGEDVMPNHTYKFKGKAIGTWLSNLFQDNKLGKRLDLLEEVKLTGFDNSHRSRDPEDVARRFIKALLSDPSPNKMKYQNRFNSAIIEKKDILRSDTKKEVDEVWELKFDEKRLWDKQSHYKDRTDEWKDFRYNKTHNPREKWSTNEKHMGQLYHWVRRRKKNWDFMALIIHKFNSKEKEELKKEGFPIEE